MMDTNGVNAISPTPHEWNLSAGLSQQWLRTSNPTSKVPAAYRSGGLAYHFTNAGIGAHEHLAKTIHRIEVYADEAQINVVYGTNSVNIPYRNGY